MVLTNFECWAHSGNVVGGGVGINADIEHQLGGVGVGVGGIIAASRHVDLFNPRAVQQTLGQASQQQHNSASMESQTPVNSVVSHISSNGYYGFSYVNTAHELNNNNDMLNNNNNNNNNTCNNNVHNDDAAAPPAARCKKRFFVNDGDVDADFLIANKIDADNNNHGQHVAAKRCRYDDDFTAQYFNDFFTMQTATSAQIGTQSCLMDTDDPSQLFQQTQEEQELLTPHQMESVQQQQVDVAMTATSQHTTINAPSNAYNSSLQQQQYQGHLHRTNRDINRYNIQCNFSAPIPIKSSNNSNTTTNNNINSNKQMQAINENNNVNKTLTFKTESTDSLNESSNACKASLHLHRNANTCSNASNSSENNSKLESLFTATHGGSRYHYWKYCNSNSNSNSNCNNNSIQNKESKANENFCEEF